MRCYKMLHDATVFILNKTQYSHPLYILPKLKKMETTFFIQTGTQQTDAVIIQNNLNGSAAFNRSWNEFKVGFGDFTTDIWIGNECLNQLTRYGAYRVKIEILSTANLTYWFWADYDRFIVGNESTGYQLQISGYSCIAGDAFNGADVSFVTNLMKFTTYDQKNDLNPTANCAVHRVLVQLVHGGVH